MNISNQNLKCGENEKCITYFKNLEGVVGKCIPKSVSSKCYRERSHSPQVISPSWSYDIETGNCIERLYFENSVSTNFFQTLQDCQNTCKTQCAEPMCTKSCNRGYKKNKFGCMTCECAGHHRVCEPLICESDCLGGYKVDR